mmetsp:Transcript_76401/g.199126  ORF Transcript_76401/g.199126 Transcript_76401/m.199126 type:complete len:235 (+) Transcript_76401:908-1612(+)
MAGQNLGAQPRLPRFVREHQPNRESGEEHIADEGGVAKLMLCIHASLQHQGNDAGLSHGVHRRPARDEGGGMQVSDAELAADGPNTGQEKQCHQKKFQQRQHDAEGDECGRREVTDPAGACLFEQKLDEAVIRALLTVWLRTTQCPRVRRPSLLCKTQDERTVLSPGQPRRPPRPMRRSRDVAAPRFEPKDVVEIHRPTDMRQHSYLCFDARAEVEKAGEIMPEVQKAGLRALG